MMGSQGHFSTFNILGKRGSNSNKLFGNVFVHCLTRVVASGMLSRRARRRFADFFLRGNLSYCRTTVLGKSGLAFKRG